MSAAITAIILTVCLHWGMIARRVAATLISEGLPADVMVVSSGLRGIGPLAFATKPLDDEIVEALARDGRLRGIAIEEALAVPARVAGSLFGNQYGSDVAVVGIDTVLLGWYAPEVDPDGFRDREPLPIIAPEVVLDAYNHSFAEANSLPRLTRSAFAGQVFTIEIGASSLKVLPEARAVPATIAGFSTNNRFLGLAGPRDFVARTNRNFGMAGSRRVFLMPRTAEGGRSLGAELAASGLAVSSPEERLSGLARLDVMAASILGAAGLGLALLAGVTSHFATRAFIHERADEAELLHHLCLSRREIAAHFIRRIAVPGTLGALIGSVTASTASSLLMRALADNYSMLSGAAMSVVEILVVIAAGAAVPAAGILAGALKGAMAVSPVWRR